MCTVFLLACWDHNSEIAEESLPSPSGTMSYRDMVLRNQDVQQGHTVSNTKNAGGSMSMVALLSKHIAPSAANSGTGSSDCAVDGFVVVTRKKQHEVGMATSPLNPKQSIITRPL